MLGWQLIRPWHLVVVGCLILIALGVGYGWGSR